MFVKHASLLISDDIEEGTSVVGPAEARTMRNDRVMMILMVVCWFVQGI